MKCYAECGTVEFELSDNGDGVLNIIATKNGKEIGVCYVNKAGEYFGHDGGFAIGFEDPVVEKFSQEVFYFEIEKWLENNKKVTE